MAGGARQSAFQLIQTHIAELSRDLATIEDKKKLLEKQKEFVEEDIYKKLDSVIDAIKKCHSKVTEQVEEAFQEQRRKLEETKKKLEERKFKAENELIVDHKPVEIPDVGEFCFTVKVDDVMKAVGKIRANSTSGNSGQRNLSQIIVKQEEPDEEQFSSEYTKKLESKTLFPVAPSFISSFFANKKTEKRKSEDQSVSLEKGGEASGSDCTPSNPSTNPTFPEKKRKMTAQTLRDYVECKTCHKPRCVFSDKTLEKEDKESWRAIKASLRYRCGGSLFSPLDGMLSVEPTDCSKVVSWTFYSRPNEHKFPQTCFNCGRVLDRPAVRTDDTNNLIIHEVCNSCKESGVEPRTRKKSRPPQKISDVIPRKIQQPSKTP